MVHESAVPSEARRFHSDPLELLQAAQLPNMGAENQTLQKQSSSMLLTTDLASPSFAFLSLISNTEVCT